MPKLDLDYLFDNKNDSDIEIELSRGHISAHKVVLKHGSRMLRALLNVNFADNTGPVKFPQHDDATVIAMIKYMYGCKIVFDGDFDTWSRLYTVADYADIPDLVELLCANLPAQKERVMEFAHDRGSTSIMYSVACWLNDTDYVCIMSLPAWLSLRTVWLKMKNLRAEKLVMHNIMIACNAATAVDELKLMNMFVDDLALVSPTHHVNLARHAVFKNPIFNHLLKAPYARDRVDIRKAGIYTMHTWNEN